MEAFALASLAVVAGVASFTSPCVLPLLPGYVSYVSGLAIPAQSAARTAEVPVPARLIEQGTDTLRDARRRVRTGATLFVLGFATVFTLLGLGASAVGLRLAQNRTTLSLVGGTFIVVMGLAMLGVLRVPLLQRQLRFPLDRFRRGPASAFPLGVTFAFGWTPCVGPVLTAILATAATSQSLWRGAVLLAAYSGGLGIPFLLLAAGVVSGKRRPEWLARHSRRIEVAGGLLIVVMGLAVLSGNWTTLMSRALSVYARLGWPPI